MTAEEVIEFVTKAFHRHGWNVVIDKENRCIKITNPHNVGLKGVCCLIDSIEDECIADTLRCEAIVFSVNNLWR